MNNKVSTIDPAISPDALLSRDMGVRQLAANIFNYVVGGGIFALPAFAVMHLGPAAPLAYLACAVVIGLVVLCFAEAGSRVSSTGGSYAYVETALGPMIGFVAGCLVFTIGLFGAAAVVTALVHSLLALFPPMQPWVVNTMIVIIVAILAGLNMRGVRLGCRLVETITVFKLLPLLAFVLIGVFLIDPANLVISEAPSIRTVLSTAGIVVFAFTGIEGAMLPSGEVKESARTVPRAILIALGGATLLYLAVQYVALGIMGLGLAKAGNTPLAAAAGAALGPVASTVMIIGAVVSMLGYLSANILSEPRGLFALSRDGFLPQRLARVHPRFQTPNFAIGLYGVVLAALALSGTFEWLAIFANLAALALYFLCAIATWVLRKRDVRTAGEPFVVPGGPAVFVAACVTIAWLFYETAKDGTQFYALLIALAIIFAVYALRRLRSRQAIGS